MARRTSRGSGRSSSKSKGKSSRASKGKSRYGSNRDRRRQSREDRDKDKSFDWLNAEAKFFKPKKGTHHLRIIPYEVTVDDHKNAEPGELYWEKEVEVIFGLGANETTVAPTEAARKKLRAHVSNLLREEIIDEEEAKEFYSKKRMLYNVLDLDSDDPDEVLLWEISFYCFQKLLDTECDEDEQYDAYTELEEGYSIKVRFAEESTGTFKFLKADKITFVEAEDLDDSIVDDCYDLDAIIKYTDADELMKLVEEHQGMDDGGVDEVDDDEPEEEPEEKPKRSRRRSRKQEPEEEPEEELEEVSDGGKSSLEVGGTIIFEEDGDDLEAEITSIPPNGDEIQIRVEGEEDIEFLNIADIKSYSAPEKKRSSRRRSKKNQMIRPLRIHALRGMCLVRTA